MEMLQLQSLSESRRDGFVADSKEKKALEQKESHWPHVVHGAFCMTNQAPNEDGSKEAEFLDKPELRFWAGSEESAVWMMNIFREQKRLSGGSLLFRPIIHTNYAEYRDGLRSESAINKPPPPRSNESSVDMSKIY